MRGLLSFLFIFVLFFFAVNEIEAQIDAGLTGTKTIPGDYATIKAAITDINSSGVGSGGVIFNVTAGYAETLVTDSLYLTATGTSSNPIVFQKYGSGSNPCVTRTDAGLNATSSIGGRGDAIIIIGGSDYVTFDGIDVTSSNSGIEYGYYIRKASATDGCKYVTVKNCVITMTKGTSAYVIGLYSSNNIAGSSLSSFAGVTVTSEGGRHENVTITGNTIQNTFSGMYFVGYNHTTSPYNYYDQNFVIGANGAGNIIKNFGGNVASTVNGINIIYHNNESIAYNTLNNTDGGNTGFTSYGNGILLNTGKAVTLFVNYNTISISNTSAATSKYLYGIQVNAGDASSTITINNNTFKDFVCNGTGVCAPIYHGTAANINIYSNLITSITSVSSIVLIHNYAGTGTNNIYNNTISNINSTATSTTAAAISGIAIIKGSNNIYNNLIYNINASASGYTDGIRGINITSSTTSINKIYYNTIYLNTSSSGTNYGSSCIYHTYSATSTISTLDMRNNIFMNISTANGTGVTAAFRRSASTDLNNYASTSNNNCFYAGTASSSNLLYYDGTNSIRTIADYKTLVSPRESSSLGVDPLLHSPVNLYVTPVSPVIEAGAVISDYTTDYNGNTRSITAPTIGAYEVSSNTATTSGSVTNPTASTENEIISTSGQGGITFNPSSTLTGYIKGNFFSSGNTGAPPSGITNMSSYYWSMTTNVSSFAGTARFYFNNIENSGVLYYSTLKLLKRNGPGDNWAEYTDVTRNTTYIQANNITSFSEWAFGGDEDNPLPVLISLFNYSISKNIVTLNWTTSQEINNVGFDVERKTAVSNEWAKLSFVSGKGNSNNPVWYSYEDKTLNNGKYYYRLKQISNNGNFEYFKLSGTVDIGVPSKYILSQNYPNPFNPVTKINFDVPQHSFITLIVYDITGREIATLVNEIKQAGRYSVDFNGANLSSGVYLCKLKSTGFSEVKRMLLIK